jgi:hypothetical protein
LINFTGLYQFTLAEHLIGLIYKRFWVARRCRRGYKWGWDGGYDKLVDIQHCPDHTQNNENAEKINTFPPMPPHTPFTTFQIHSLILPLAWKQRQATPR